MKKILFALAITSLLFSFTLGQKKSLPKQVDVTARTIASEPRGPYVLPLTRPGTVYNLAADVDYSRIQVHTAKGDLTMAEVIKKSGRKLKGKSIIGLTSDIRAMKVAIHRGGGGLNYDCNALACVCKGDDDCNNLFSSGKCGPLAVCNADTGECFCLTLGGY